MDLRILGSCEEPLTRYAQLRDKTGFTQTLYCPHCSQNWWTIRRRPKARSAASILFQCLECGGEFRRDELDRLGGWA